MLLRILREGIRLYCWKMIAIFLNRNVALLLSFSSHILQSFIVSVPVVGGSKPAKIWIRVVFPLPLSPINAVDERSLKVKFSLLKTWKVSPELWKDLHRSLTFTTEFICAFGSHNKKFWEIRWTYGNKMGFLFYFKSYRPKKNLLEFSLSFIGKEFWNNVKT